MNQTPVIKETAPSLQTLKRLAIGVGMLGLAAGAAELATSGSDTLTDKVAYTTDHAQPSDALALVFDALETGGAVLGGVVIAKRGAHHVRTAFNPADTALYGLAKPDTSKHRFLRLVTSASVLTAGAGAMTGNYLDTADAASHSQAKVGQFLVGAAGSQNGGLLFTNTSHPELADNATVNPEASQKLILAAAAQGETLIPARWEWHQATRPGKPNGKLQILATSLPEGVTHLPIADAKCDNVSVAAAHELGVEVGQTFEMDNLTLRVSRKLPESAGLNLIPVLLNNEDFARCVDTNEQQPFSVLLGNMSKDKSQLLLAEAGVNANDISKRVFVVPSEEFLSNTLQTGKNSVNGLVLQAMALGLLFGGVALSGKTSSQLINNRENNRMLKVNGFSERMIARLYTEMAEADALQSSLLAVPGVFLVDAFTNTSQPGAALGPSINTYLCVVGLTWAVKRVGTSLAVRQERGLEEKEQAA